MKRMIGAVSMAVVLGIGVLLGGAMTGTALAEEESSFSAGTDHAFNSKYIWRGINATNDPVWQPDVWVSYKGFTFNTWGNYEFTDVNNNEGRFTEWDFNVDYSWALDDFSFSAGGILYVFPHVKDSDTVEVYGSVGYDTLLQPALTVYYDIDAADGFYGTLSIGHSFEIPKLVDPVSMSLDLSTQVGVASKNWNNFYYGADHTAFVDSLTSVSLPIGIGDNVSITPSVAYSTTLDKTLSSKAANDHEFIFGVVLSAEI